MITIRKFNTVENGFKKKFSLSIPKNSKILTVQLDKNFSPCIWVMIDTNEELEERFFELFTDEEEIVYDMGVDRKYLGTYQYQRGEFVGHLFERIN